MKSIVTIEKVVDWGQPPANNYILSSEGGVYVGGLTSSSSIRDNTLDSAAYVVDTRISATPSPVVYASRQEVDTLANELLREDAELYRRLAQ